MFLAGAHDNTKSPAVQTARGLFVSDPRDIQVGLPAGEIQVQGEHMQGWLASLGDELVCRHARILSVAIAFVDIWRFPLRSMLPWLSY
jgi:hypothetical protein